MTAAQFTVHRSQFRALYYGGLRSLGVASLWRCLQDAGPIFCYHNVVAPGDHRAGESGLHLTRDRFERHVRWMTAHYEVVPLVDFVSRVAFGERLRSVAAITFDDAYAGVFEHAVPVLAAHRVPATVFVVAGAAGRRGFWWDHPDVVAAATPERRRRWLTDLRGDEAAIFEETAAGAQDLPASHHPAAWSMIRAHAGDLIDIGGHSATHRSLPALSDAELKRELVASRAAIRAATGIWPRVFAYPYGLSSPRVEKAVRSAGYRAAVGLDAGLNRAGADVWRLRRINVPAGISDAAFEAWAAGLHARGRG